MSYTKKEIAQYTLSMIAVLVFIYLVSTIDESFLERVTTGLGWWGFVFFIGIIITTQIFAPVSGTAFCLVGIKLYGYGVLMILFYVGSMIACVISFYIARRWGRRIVIKLIGEKSMNHIDQVTESHENSLLVVGRLLGFFFFDFVSYALGFTKISFKKYFTYTALLTIPPLVAQYFIFRNLDFTSFKGLAIWYISTAITGILFAYFVFRLLKSKNPGFPAQKSQ